MLERDRERLREFAHAFLGECAEGRAGFVVDDLDHADQLGAALLDDRRHELLLGAVSGALVDFLQEAQVRIDRLQFGLVVDVLDVGQLARQRDVARDRMLRDRQLEVLEGVQSGLDLRDDRLFVLAHRVDREAVGVEQLADVGTDLEHDLVDVAGGVDLVRDQLQLLLERELDVNVGLRCRRMTQYRAHWIPPYMERLSWPRADGHSTPTPLILIVLFRHYVTCGPRPAAHRPPSSRHTLKPLWANRKAAAELRRPLWQ